MGIYENIKNAAAARGVTVKQVEADLSLPRSSISKFDRNSPSAERIAKISDYLGVSSDYLIKGEMTEGYYMDSEVAKMAQDLVESPGRRTLFDMTRGMSEERLSKVCRFIEEFMDDNHESGADS